MGKNKNVKINMKRVFNIILCITYIHILSISICYSNTVSVVLPDKILSDFKTKSVKESDMHPES